MRLFLTSVLLLVTIIAASAKDKADSIIAFHGYILSEDSVPVENAYLISYQTTKIIMTDSTGFFNTYLHPGDSLMINHLTLKPTVVHANEKKASANKYYVAYRHYQIPEVTTHRYDRDQYYFQKNIKKIYADLERLGLRNPNVNQSGFDNPYNPDLVSPGVGIDLVSLFRLFKRK